MPEIANILVVSDLHFGEELLPGASLDRRRAVEIGVATFREFLRYHTVRRSGGKPWRLVIAGDLFDFMSVVINGSAEHPARTSDERRFGLGRGDAAGVIRMRLIAEAHKPLLVDLVKFAAAGHRVDIIVGNHDVELLAPEVVAELRRHLEKAAEGPAASIQRTLDRIAVVPWFIYEPGVAWIEHGHVYDEGCSFEFNLCPTDPLDGRLIFNADYAAIRYLGSASPDLDPHGIEEWGFLGYMQYAWGQGMKSFGRLVVAYGRFTWSLFGARAMHQSIKRRHRRRRHHRARLADVAVAGGLTPEAGFTIDRLARTPLTVSWRRLGRMVMLDRWGLMLGVLLAFVVLLIATSLLWALAGTGLAILAAIGFNRWLGKHLVTSQLPMRSVPARIKSVVDVPVVVFGHTHDPRWQPLRGGGVYVNSGTWLPATRPGLRRSFTHVMIQPRDNALPLVELRQWRDGASQAFDARADIGAGVTTLPGVHRDQIDVDRLAR